jgi:hypothetical protein
MDTFFAQIIKFDGLRPRLLGVICSIFLYNHFVILVVLRQMWDGDQKSGGGRREGREGREPQEGGRVCSARDLPWEQREKIKSSTPHHYTMHTDVIVGLI